ncbi:MAG: type III pantothenate kinase [Verrucomicrobiia bacterium]
MSGPFLLINVNNTFTKVALASGSRLRLHPPVPTRSLKPAFFRLLKKRFPSHRVVLASVVPQASAPAQRIWNPDHLEILSHRSPLAIPIHYPHPAQIGADRLANAVAAAHAFPLPCIVVDFGTATTFDVIASDGGYLGGVIAPGLNAMTDYLHQRTALLPRLTLAEPSRNIGRSTQEAMQIGTVRGYRGLIREILHGIATELGPLASVIATGGQGGLIAKGMPEIDIVDPRVTLHGLRLVAERRWP